MKQRFLLGPKLLLEPVGKSRIIRAVWQEVGTAILSACRDAQAGETKATLVDQPKGKELEYRVIAINKSGDGSPSNTVMAVV